MYVYYSYEEAEKPKSRKIKRCGVGVKWWLNGCSCCWFGWLSGCSCG